MNETHSKGSSASLWNKDGKGMYSMFKRQIMESPTRPNPAWLPSLNKETIPTKHSFLGLVVSGTEKNKTKQNIQTCWEQTYQFSMQLKHLKTQMTMCAEVCTNIPLFIAKPTPNLKICAFFQSQQVYQ
ncbi:uncharacterized protein PHA67_017908 [Liasis olivaceus]